MPKVLVIESDFKMQLILNCYLALQDLSPPLKRLQTQALSLYTEENY